MVIQGVDGVLQLGDPVVRLLQAPLASNVKGLVTTPP